MELRSVLAPDSPVKVAFLDEGPKLSTGLFWSAEFSVSGSTSPLRVTLVYTDYPGERLINNLILVVYDPAGKFHLGNDLKEAGTPDAGNNVEAVVVDASATGTWKVQVVASEVQQDPQRFALVVSGAGLTQLTGTPIAMHSAGSRGRASKSATTKKSAGAKGRSRTKTRKKSRRG